MPPRYKIQSTYDYYLEVSKNNIDKQMMIHKFGRSNTVLNGIWSIVSDVGGVYSWLEAPTKVKVKAGGDVNDTIDGTGARTIKIFGITVDNETGLTQDDSEEISLLGALSSALTSKLWWRVYRVIVQTAGSYSSPVNVGNIIIQNQAEDNDLIMIVAGEAQSQHCAVSIPHGWTGLLLGYDSHIDASKPADSRVLSRENFTTITPPVSARRVRELDVGITGDAGDSPKGAISTVPGPCDIWMEARGSGQTTSVSSDMEILCVTNDQLNLALEI